ncbi:hypothetical protein [Marinimicrobium sp. UBA4209]|uniref:hypothetical protein n=3 Tax=Marinimicrobium TaxID=359337 RepID=UPI00257996CB|nr:hypothetical protein [Marinimicrobium sp. UBA4209]
MDVPIFSVNDTVLVVAVLECLLLGALLLFITQIPLAQRLFLSLFLLSLGVDFLDTLIYWAEPLKARWLSDHLYTFYVLKPLGLMAAPALYLYVNIRVLRTRNCSMPPIRGPKASLLRRLAESCPSSFHRRRFIWI